MSRDMGWQIDRDGNKIHHTAIVGSDTSLGRENSIGPYSIVGGMGCQVSVGNRNSIGAGCIVGSPAENATGYPGIAHLNFSRYADAHPQEVFAVRIGDNCVIRDRVTIHAGLINDTRIGDFNYLHSGTHLNHDCQTEIGVVFAPSVISAGRTYFGAFSQIGLGSCLHQDCSVEALAMIGMNSTVKGRIPAMSMHFGSPSRLRGANRVRLARLGLNESQIDEVESFLMNSIATVEDVKERFRVLLDELIAESSKRIRANWNGQR